MGLGTSVALTTVAGIVALLATLARKKGQRSPSEQAMRSRISVLRANNDIRTTGATHESAVLLAVPQDRNRPPSAALESVTGYIVALDTIPEQEIARATAHAILGNQLQQINDAASAYLETFSENHVG
jgi:hypothetical protein